MKRAGPGWLSMVIGFLVWLLFLACGVFAVWLLFTGEVSAPVSEVVPSPSSEELAAGGLLSWGFVLFYAYRIFYLGRTYLLYDEERVVFVWNRRDRQTFRWSELKQAGIRLRSLSEVEPVMGVGFFFEFPDRKRMPFRPVVSGYWDLAAMLEKKGFLSTQTKNSSFWVDN